MTSISLSVLILLAWATFAAGVSCGIGVMLILIWNYGRQRNEPSR